MRKIIAGVLILVACAWAALAPAADMSASQRDALRTAILAAPDLASLYTIGDLSGLADALNATATPAVVVWRKRITRHEILTATCAGAGSSFKWAGNGYITRSDGERAAFRDMFNDTGGVDPSLTNIQAAFTDIFSGTGNAADNRAHIVCLAKRNASRFESVFATGAGTSQAPSTMAIEGPVLFSDLIGL